METTAAPTRETAPETTKPRRQPPYHVILWDDDDHTYAYVQEMMARLFRMPSTKAYDVARTVDTRGRAIVLTTTREHAELKRDQIHAFGRDRLMARSKGAMTATIEPAI